MKPSSSQGELLMKTLIFIILIILIILVMTIPGVQIFRRKLKHLSLKPRYYS